MTQIQNRTGRSPLIWTLCGARAGDTAQALELARLVGGRLVEKNLSFNALHFVPNVLMGAGLQILTMESRKSIVPPWPELVIATGKRTATVARAVKTLSGGKSKLVQLGRPRAALRHFDLVITTPQYGLPDAPNVIRLPTPFAAPKAVDASALESWTAAWQHLPRPRIMAAIGASKFPLILGPRELESYARALNDVARKMRGSILLFDSPRSAKGALLAVSSCLTVPHWSASPDEKGAYQSGLCLADHFSVTSDSVSMVTEMLATGKAVAVHRLPRRKSFHWSADHGLAAMLARSGFLSPPRNVDRFVATLIEQDRLGVLGPSWGKPSRDNREHEIAVARVKQLLTRT
jgi:uncharacterized protein